MSGVNQTEKEAYPVEQFKILKNGNYLTASRKLSLLAKLLPSFHFYVNAFFIILGGSRKAKRGEYGDRGWCDNSFELMRALEHVGVMMEVSGGEHFTALREPCVFIGNHMSTLETFVLPVLIEPYKDVTFVVKQSLVDYPIFKYLMRSRDPITVGRENAREDLRAVLEGGTERLKAGRSIIIFPQTTRTPVFDPSQFNTIGIKLAKRAGVPVVPIALKTDAWSNGTWVKDYGKVDPSMKVFFEFGKPLRITGRGDEEHEQIVQFITERLKRWGGRGGGSQ
jgi:1-acyl-sn-glycerol-3-phosphate acyltransferase